MTSSNIDINSTLEKFKEEMDKGLEREGPIVEVSIPMIATYLNPEIEVKTNEKVIVIDAGGTNLRVGLAYFDGEKWIIEDVKEDKMPGIEREFGKDEFFDYIAIRTKPLLDKAKNIGFCFSYRVAMDKSLDGCLISWAKEIKAREVVGAKVGLELLKAIKKYDSCDREIVVLNDTTSVLLGGRTLDKDNEFRKYVGAIYGTGFNCCYIEDTKNIKKLKDLESGSMIINTETGNFNGFNRGLFDIELTNNSLIVDEALTEKMSSGRYLAVLIHKALSEAVKRGLLSDKTKVLKEEDFNLPLVSKFLSKEKNELDNSFINEEDKEIFKDICLELIDRASKIVAITISAFALKSNVDRIGIIIEGSTFYKLPTFKESFNKYLKVILDEKKIEYKLFDGRNMILLGAAIAAMAK